MAGNRYLQTFGGASVIAISSIAFGQLPAFSGADGGGAAATGGRGGLVYHVTRLDGNEINASGGRGTVLGSLAYGINDNNFKVGGVVQPRTIVFDVGGTFWLGQKTPSGGSPPTEGWDTQDPLSLGSKITIAGQTAPGGVYIVGGGLKVNGTNAIIRNVTVAPGYGARSLNSTTGYADSYVYDGMNIHTSNVMVDHATFVFATDEAVSADEFAGNVSVQYSNISQGQDYPQADAENPGVYTGHALGSLLQAGSNAPISFHHDLYAHQKGRLPRVGTEAGSLSVAGVGAYNDFRDNVFYNWLGTGGSGASGQPGQSNFVNNFWRAGPGGDSNSGTTIVNSAGGTGIFSGSDSTNTKVFHSGNLKDTNKDGDANDGVALTNSDFGSSNFQGGPLWFGGVPTYTGVTDTATAAYNRVVNYAGANWSNRDTIDTRIFNETQNGTGKIMAFNDPTHGTEWNALLNLRPATLGGIGGTGAYARPANWDTDGDGMPDTWEASLGLNPNVADNNGDFDNDGYTNVEEYINELGEWPAPQPIVFAAPGNNGRYALIANWDIKWQPSKYDTAKVTNGATAHVDAVGQHAGTLLVGEGGNGSLSLDSGWIRVHTLVRVRETGHVSFNGGAMDITSGAGIFDYSGATSPLAALVAQIASGRNGGAWNGPGINSSVAATTPGVGIGIAEASRLGLTTFAGQSVDSTTVLMAVTWLGDTDLNGVVDVNDLSNLAMHWQSAGIWTDGDFNYDGVVDATDLGMLALNWQSGNSFAQMLASLGLPAVSVPEPAVAIASIGLLMLGLRRANRPSIRRA